MSTRWCSGCAYQYAWWQARKWICVCVCVLQTEREREGEFRGTNRKEEVFGLLNANKKLKAYLQCVIPTTQLGIFLFLSLALTGLAAKGYSARTPPCDRNKNPRVCLCRRETEVWADADMLVTTQTSPFFPKASVAIFSPNVSLLHC